MMSSEASPSSSSVNSSSNHSKPKSKCSIRYLIENFKPNFCISNPKLLENNHHHTASSSGTTNTSRALSISYELICKDLLLLRSALRKAKNNMGRINVLFNQDCEKFEQALQRLEELQTKGSNDRDLDEDRKAIAKLKIQIPSHMKIQSAHCNPWPNVNNVEDDVMHFFYKEPEFEERDDCLFKALHDRDCVLNALHDRDCVLKAFRDLPKPLRHCLLCYFKFPPVAIIKRTVMIYLWIGAGFLSGHLPSREEHPPKDEKELLPEEDVGNRILDEFIAKGFLGPVYQKCNLVPDSCKMSLFVRSSLSEDAETNGFTWNNTNLDLHTEFAGGDLAGQSCLVNVGEAIIDGRPEIFEKMNRIKNLYLGRWQSSATHHIEIADSKFLHGLKKLNCLKLFSLRGISMITELPSFISELKELKILDLRTCHNLEAIPNKIGLLESLTHLDMSDCYFLEHMPESLANLCNLEVLKGFFIGNYDGNKQSCSLSDLSRLLKLRKLNIYTNSKDFPTASDLESFGRFERLQKLTISWGGCTLEGKSNTDDQELKRKTKAPNQAMAAAEGPLKLPPGLHKLDLQCLPWTSLPYWIRPAKLNKLEKLYIRGGQFSNIDQFGDLQTKNPWTVEILKLKHLSKLEIDWRELRILCPKLIYFQQVECPKLTNIPCDENGVWRDKKAVDTDRVQVQQFTSTGKSSSSNLGTAPTLAQDDCKVSSIDEKQI